MSSCSKRKNCEDLYSTLAIKEDLAKKLGLEFPIRREEGSMRAARVLPEAPAGKDSVVAAPTVADQPKKQRKKGDAISLPRASSGTHHSRSDSVKMNLGHKRWPFNSAVAT